MKLQANGMSLTTQVAFYRKLMKDGVFEYGSAAHQRLMQLQNKLNKKRLGR